MEKKNYESKKTYGRNYNKQHINVQMNRELVNKLRERLGDKSLKSFFEEYIQKYLGE